jgi:hypothetical protein
MPLTRNFALLRRSPNGTLTQSQRECQQKAMIMKLNSPMLQRTLSQYQAEPIPDDHPVVLTGCENPRIFGGKRRDVAWW